MRDWANIHETWTDGQAVPPQTLEMPVLRSHGTGVVRDQEVNRQHIFEWLARWRLTSR